MEEIKRYIKVLRKGIRDRIEYVQFTNAIPIRLVITDWQIPQSAEARVFIKKPSGKEVYNNCTIEDNSVLIEPTEQMFAEFGFQRGQVQIVENDDVLATYLLDFEIEKNLAKYSEVESKDEYGVLDELVKEAQTAIQNTQEATSKANNATIAANKATDDAETAATKADSATTAANKATDDAKTAASAANSAAQQADDAAQTAENKVMELDRKVLAGDFNGATFLPSVNAAGDISWTNDKNLENPETVNIKGPKGDKGDKGDPGEVENLAGQSIKFTKDTTGTAPASGETIAALFGKQAKMFDDVQISDETIAAFEALGFDPNGGGTE